jgi:hypothetical protein
MIISRMLKARKALTRDKIKIVVGFIPDMTQHKMARSTARVLRKILQGMILESFFMVCLPPKKILSFRQYFIKSMYREDYRR